MKYSDLNIEKKAPHSGQLLAYTRTQVLFEKYTDLNKAKELLDGQELLEVHMFNKEKEYRAVATRGKRKFENCNDGVIEYVADFAYNEKEVYKETVLLDNKYKAYGSITVLNHIDYDELGMAKFDDYRLIMEV